STGEYSPRYGFQLEPHRTVESHTAYLSLTHIDLKEKFAYLTDAANLFSASVAPANHFAQIIRKRYAGSRLHYFHAFRLAFSDLVALSQRFELLSGRMQFGY